LPVANKGEFYESLFHPRAIFTWSVPSIKGKILSQWELLEFPGVDREKLQVTMSVDTPVMLNTIFPVKITVINLAKHQRDLILEIPIPELDNLNAFQDKQSQAKYLKNLEVKFGTNKEKEGVQKTEEQSKESRNIIPPKGMLSLFHEIEKKTSSILCIEKSVPLGLLEPMSEASVNIQCIALRDGLFKIEKLKLIDKLSNRLYIVEEPCEVLVVK